jgi:hypothetical protein
LFQKWPIQDLAYKIVASVKKNLKTGCHGEEDARLLILFPGNISLYLSLDEISHYASSDYQIFMINNTSASKNMK